jgi:hypothetical protein
MYICNDMYLATGTCAFKCDVHRHNPGLQMLVLVLEPVTQGHCSQLMKMNTKCPISNVEARGISRLSFEAVAGVSSVKLFVWAVLAAVYLSLKLP